MYAFMILLTISLPNGETGRFKVASMGQFDQSTCIKRADEYADRLIAHSKRRMPFALIRTASTCELREARPA
jgi:hypothetical protein